MENETQEQEKTQVEQSSSLHQVTPLSKYLAMALFIILPFLGGYVGYVYSPEKVVEVEKVIKEVEVERIVEVPVQSDEQTSSEETANAKPVISVIGYKLDRPGYIEIEYENMPLNAGGLALCIPSGPCTEWVDSTFSPTTSEGIYIMETTKGIGTGEYTITVIGNSFTDQLFVSEPFIIE